MRYQKCPVCEGRGDVYLGFYARCYPVGSTSAMIPPTERCRSCDGKGIIKEAPDIFPSPVYRPTGTADASDMR